MICRILHDEMTQIILRFIINHVIFTIDSSRNSVRVVLLIARGWRGTSLPRVNVRKEIQRRRCCAFSMKAWLQRGVLWRITLRKRNTYGVEIFFLYHDCRFFTPKFMLDCIKKLQHLQHWKNHIDLLFVACFIGISMVTCHKQPTYMLPSFINRTETHSF